MIIGPKVVAVDDNPDHLIDLAAGFDALGGLCLTLDYASAAVRIEPFPSGIRLLFMDINLLPGAGVDLGPRNFSPVLQVIRKVISPQNGPYALVTWTDRPEAHARLMEFLAGNLAREWQPCAQFCLSKGLYLGNPPALKERLGTLQRELPGLAMLLDWEKAVYDAADRSVFGIMGLSSKHGIEAGAAVVEAVRAIADAAAGSGASEEPFRAFLSGMSPVLTDRLEHAAPDETVERTWAEALAPFPQRQLNTNQIASLNSFLHFAPVTDRSRGLGVVYQLQVKEIIHFLQPEYQSGRKAILSGEFVPLKGQLKSPQNQQDILDGVTLGDSCAWRFVQLGASCDHVNRKTRVIEGLLGLQIPATSFKHTHLISSGTKFSDNPGASEWLFQAPPFIEDDEPHVLVVNLRFPLSFPQSKGTELRPLYRCRDSLASEIADHAARYGTRIGLVEFRNQLRVQ